MLIDLHAHNTLVMEPLREMHHPYWGPFLETDADGNLVGLRMGELDHGPKLSTVERKAADAGKIDAQEATKVWSSLEGRIEAMDKAGQDAQVLSLPSHFYMYWVEPEYAIPFAQQVNDLSAKNCSSYPERLFFWAQVPLQDPAAAAAELDRAVNQLGAKGVAMGGANFGGMEADDERLDPFWAKACDLAVPLWVHGYNQSVHWGSVPEHHAITSVVGMCYDESALFWNLVCGGVLDRFPDLQVIITHAGGFTPYQIGRFEGTNEVLMDSRNKRPLREYVGRNFWFDILNHEPAMRRAIVDVIGADRLVYGTNFGGSDGVREDLTEGIDLSATDREKIRSTNAIELLRLPL
jgi:predicted TIM-barrel fold metal-dependent hydrolase